VGEKKVLIGLGDNHGGGEGMKGNRRKGEASPVLTKVAQAAGEKQKEKKSWEKEMSPPIREEKQRLKEKGRGLTSVCKNDLSRLKKRILRGATQDKEI